MSVSIPLKVLYDAIGTKVSLELANGEVYSGTLTELQDTMNVLLVDAKKISKSGKETAMKSVFLRGSNVVFFQLPDLLQMSPALLAAGNLVPKALDKRGDGKGFGNNHRFQND
ncbi:unnamed protein product [Phytomonas sp. Hart1]|nr:unnamed protein product [Phytomonas sp. Hart1]|eukprot:CCW67182.1 unnamed protein product [Phytomonas sp. isolate Hart1]